MRYAKKFGLFASAVLLGLTFMTVNTSAQVRIGISLGRPYYRRPVVRRYYTPVYNYGYYGNPYWRNEERYDDRRDLNSDVNHLRRDQYKYYSDGYVTPGEQNNLRKDYSRINRDRRRLYNDW